MYRLCVGAHDMHMHSIAHGDIKIENIVYCAADHTLRFIDYDLMFSYGLQSTLTPMTSTSWRPHVMNLTSTTLLQRFCSKGLLAITCATDTYYFPPDNIFMNQTELFSTSDKQMDNICTPFNTFIDGYLQLLPSWQACMEREFKPAVQALRDAGRMHYVTHIHDIVSTLFRPDAHMIFQLGFVLRCIVYKLEKRLDELPHVHRQLMELCSAAMMPLAARRLSWEAFLTGLQQVASECTRVRDDATAAGK